MSSHACDCFGPSAVDLLFVSCTNFRAVRLVEHGEGGGDPRGTVGAQGLAVRFAAQRATPDDIDELEQILDEMRRREADTSWASRRRTPACTAA
jgi:hypothetical protein